MWQGILKKVFSVRDKVALNLSGEGDAEKPFIEHLEDLRTRADDFEPLSVDRFIAGALQPAAWYVRAQRFRCTYRAQVQALFRDWDVVLAPATPVSAPLLGSEWLDVNGEQLPCRPSHPRWW